MNLISILLRYFREHLLFHLFIPLLVGILAEIGYLYIHKPTEFPQLFSSLISPDRIALYVGIFLTYLLISIILIRRETAISPTSLNLATLEDKLKDAKSVFAIATLRFNEWFDPTVQLYLASLLQPMLQRDSFIYERVILLGDRYARSYLENDYLDKHEANCLIGIHNRLNIKHYYLDAPHVFKILNDLSLQEKIDIGYYPKLTGYFPEKLARFLMIPLKRRKVRKIAALMIQAEDGSKSAFRFSKHEKIVELIEEATNGYDKLTEKLKEEIFDRKTGHVNTKHDFTRFYPH